MKKTFIICGAILLAAVIAAALFAVRGKQEKPADTSKELQPTHTGLDEGAAKPLPMQHEHHGFMQGGMHHAVAKGVTLGAKVDAAAHTVTLRVGPMNLPAHTSHMKMPQPPDLAWEVPIDGWQRERRAGNSAASRGVLERESRGFSLPQQGRTYFRRGKRDDGLGRNARLWISRAKG